jgi:hypothetical protein
VQPNNLSDQILLQADKKKKTAMLRNKRKTEVIFFFKKKKGSSVNQEIDLSTSSRRAPKEKHPLIDKLINFRSRPACIIKKIE